MLKKYVEEGGSLLVMLGEGGEKLNKTNINYLLEEYGMSINSGTSLTAGAPSDHPVSQVLTVANVYRLQGRTSISPILSGF